MSEYAKTAQMLVRDHYNATLRPALAPPIQMEDVYLVWFCKTLQNWKALVSTFLPDTRYYEVTHDGDRDETYIDTYIKESNRVITGAVFPG